MSIDEYLTDCQFSEYHEIEIQRSPEIVFPIIKTVKFTKSKIINFLFIIRGLPRGMQSLKGFMDNGFILLDVKKNEGLVLGFLFGRKGIKIVSPDAFKQFNAKGYIKCVWNFKLSGRQDATLLSTETRVFCTCKASKFFFSIYWFFIAYFSGLTRVIILKLIKQEAEAAS